MNPNLPRAHRQLMIERQCLRTEILVITQQEQKKTQSTASVRIADRLRRIDAISQTLAR